jgi:hypothetical protein
MKRAAATSSFDIRHSPFAIEFFIVRRFAAK